MPKKEQIINCPCGKTIKREYRKIHETTKAHKDYLYKCREINEANSKYYFDDFLNKTILKQD